MGVSLTDIPCGRLSSPLRSRGEKKGGSRPTGILPVVSSFSPRFPGGNQKGGIVCAVESLYSTAVLFFSFEIDILNFDIVSDLEFRISNLDY